MPIILDGTNGITDVDGGTVLSTADVATQAQAEAGTDNTTLMTPLRVEQHMLANDLGWGQTWQDVRSSRYTNTSYQNTTNRPIQLAIQLSSTTDRLVQVSPNNSTWIQIGVSSAYTYVVVPVGYYYRVNEYPSVIKWVELR